MLKALELIGFKSFADKTRLEFPTGITVVVGPNGSGKSNIVDAIKWVLGEQSVKSLRGKEMADVIFNGSASRRPLNAAEVSLVFDNASRKLAVDAPEVHITRRVYRSGEGEYLINRQQCRLRDIRDLLAGTGLGAEAYSVIEQGKVDVLLQSSPRERRLIFEEAAGISRFKSKKVESQRRLERVEQNLLRLTDIVDEVESRLKSVRQQAVKAQRYKEYADRMQLLRTSLALVDLQRLTQELQAIEAEVANSRDELRDATAQSEACQAQIIELEHELAAIEQTIGDSHLRVAENRERIASCESAIEHQRRRQHDLDDEIGLHRRQLTSMTARADDLDEQLRANQDSLAEVDRQQRELAATLIEQDRALARLTAELERARAESETARGEHLEQLRAGAALSSRISALDAQAQAAEVGHEHGSRRLAELQTAFDAAAAQHAELAPRFAELAEKAAAERAAAQAVEARLGETRVEHARCQNELGALRERQSRASERYAVLEELERKQDGLNSGVKEVLQRARSTNPGPLAKVVGLVADLLQVHIDRAPLIEAALGELAQHVVVSSGRELLLYLQAEGTHFSGRVTFLRLDAPPIAAADLADFEQEPGVLGRADRFVETAPEHAVLARRLLGAAWIVDTLARAIALAEGAQRGVCFITQAGELVSSDGAVAVGSRGGPSGLISRRSELRALRQQIADLGAQVGGKRERVEAMERSLAEDGADLAVRSARVAVVERELADVKLRALAAEQRVTQLGAERQSLIAEVRAAEETLTQARAALVDARKQLTEVESLTAELDARARDGAAAATQLEQTRVRSNREASATRIDVARIEQQREDLGRRAAQLDRDRQERGRSLAENRSQLELATHRATETERHILAAESEAALLYLRKESLASETIESVNRREEARTRRAALSQDDQRLRARARKLESKLHARELSTGETRHSLATIAERIREDYGLELASLAEQPAAELDVARPEAEQEIVELRGKLNSIGSVNLDALEELDQLDVRFRTLHAQHQDLSTAKAELEQAINKINADCRRLFGETLEVVRGYFQTLFRKLFGGGQADILLDEGVDILESGIEIVARPPGKEPRSISLLSGGEKTLTCVAMLMAIFRSRPSPFCVLDEVDAALDEANIERFVNVLGDFLTWTQFIVVTHSKKTMTCAGAIYGITMQESGVSKRVSVRFDDVRDNGEFVISPEAAKEAAKEAAASDEETQAA